MIYIWQNTVIIMLITSLAGNAAKKRESCLPSDWRILEMIAEDFPYVVALLSQSKRYICTGVAISENTVLTTGKCVSPVPEYVVIGQAVLNNFISKNKFIKIAHVVKHPDYTFFLEPSDPEITVIHSNIGIVYTVRHIFDLYYEIAQMGNLFAPELHDTQFSAVGYVSINKNEHVLHRRSYHQEACANPKWYYCMCGFAKDHVKNSHGFGEGGPVVINTDIVAVITVPCGKLQKPDTGVSYDIFTIIGPYLTWINKLRYKHTLKFSEASGASLVNLFSMNIYVLLLITISTVFL